MESYEEIFAKIPEEKLISAVKNGMDPYLRNYCPEALYFFGSKYETFFGAAIRYGTPALVRACVEMGADVNYIDRRQEHSDDSEFFASSLVAAIRSFNTETLRALLECGAKIEVLNDLAWDLQRNFIPEAKNDEAARKIKKRLDTGAEILRILTESGCRIRGMNPDDKGMSFYDCEEDSTFVSLKEHNSGYFDDYCEVHRNVYVEYSFPVLGTRPGALWHAASPEALRTMIANGGDVNAADRWGWTAMHRIVFYCTSDYYYKPNEMLQILIDSGADINASEDGGVYHDENMTPLYLAARGVRDSPRMSPRMIEIFKLLLRNGAYFDVGQGRESGVIFWIGDYWGGRVEIYEEIAFEIFHFTQPDKAKEIVAKKGEQREETVLSECDIDLMTAAFWGTAEDLAPILDRGADINARSRRGYTPLMFATARHNSQAAEYLIERGANLNAKNWKGETALMVAIIEGASSVMATLVLSSFNECGTDVNARDNDGQTALMYIAASSRDIKFARALLDAGADINAIDNAGMTALDIAITESWWCTVNFVKFLLTNGADAKVMPKIVKIMEYEDEIELETNEELSKFGLKSSPIFKDVFAENGQKNIAEAIKKGLSLKIKDTSHELFFCAALRYGDEKTIKACLERGVDITDAWGGVEDTGVGGISTLPLYIAIKAVNAEAVNVLLNEEPNLSLYATPDDLHYKLNIFPEGEEGSVKAKKYKDRLDAGQKILRMLRDAGKTLDIDEYGKLTYTSGENYVPCNYDYVAPKYKTTMQTVAKLRSAVSPKALKILLDTGIDVNARGAGGSTALHCIARDYGEYFETNTMIKMLIDAGADVNAFDDEGRTPLMPITHNILRHPKALDALGLLIDSGADLRAKDVNGKSVYDWIEMDYRNSCYIKIELLHELIDAVRDHRAGTNLIAAACLGGVSEIEFALSQGANVNARSGGKYTPLMFASVFNTVEAVELLIAKGAKVNARDAEKNTALMIACQNPRPNPEIIRALIAAGAKVNAVNADGDIPLHAASANETEEIAAILIDAGAKINFRNKEGKTPLMQTFGSKPKINSRNTEGKTSWTPSHTDTKICKPARVLLASGADWHDIADIGRDIEDIEPEADNELSGREEKATKPDVASILREYAK